MYHYHILKAHQLKQDSVTLKAVKGQHQLLYFGNLKWPFWSLLVKHINYFR